MGDEREPQTTGAEGAGQGGRPARRWLFGGLAVLVVAVAIFAIAQGGGGGGAPLNAIAKAAEVTQREPGGRAVIKATVTSQGSTEAITESGTMTFDESGRARGELTVSVPTSDKEVSFVTVVDGAHTYTSSEALGDSLPAGKKWMELNLAAAQKGVSEPDPAGGGPTEGLKILERVEDPEEIGKEDIDGVPTTHYRGSLPTTGEVFGVMVSYSTLDIDVWIDAQDRVRRMTLDIAGSVGGQQSRTRMSIDFVEFGRVPKIALPDPSEVFDATSQIESQVQSAAEGQ